MVDKNAIGLAAIIDKRDGFVVGAVHGAGIGLHGLVHRVGNKSCVDGQDLLGIVLNSKGGQNRHGTLFGAPGGDLA